VTRLAQQEYAAAIRLLRRAPGRSTGHRGRPWRYGPELVPVVTQLWEVSDRPCAKLLAPLLPTLLAALERHGGLRLASEERASLRHHDHGAREERPAGRRSPSVERVPGHSDGP
jgi:hypothetical protein